MNIKELHDYLGLISEKYTLVKGLIEFEERDGVLKSRNPYYDLSFVRAGKDLDNDLFEYCFSEHFEHDAPPEKEGVWEFSVLLSYDSGQQNEFGQYEIPQHYLIEHIETKFNCKLLDDSERKPFNEDDLPF